MARAHHSEAADHALRLSRWRRRGRHNRRRRYNRRWWHNRRRRLNRRWRRWLRSIVECLIQLNGPIAESAAIDRAHAHAIHTRDSVPVRAVRWRCDLETSDRAKVIHDFDLVRVRTSHFREVDVEPCGERSEHDLRRIRWTRDSCGIDRREERARSGRAGRVRFHAGDRRGVRRKRRRAGAPDDKHACENQQH